MSRNHLWSHERSQILPNRYYLWWVGKKSETALGSPGLSFLNLQQPQTCLFPWCPHTPLTLFVLSWCPSAVDLMTAFSLLHPTEAMWDWIPRCESIPLFSSWLPLFARQQPCTGNQFCIANPTSCNVLSGRKGRSRLALRVNNPANLKPAEITQHL